MNSFVQLAGIFGTYEWPQGFEWVGSILDALDTILWPILALVAAAGIIYAIYLGVELAKAESSDKQDEAKKRIINALIAIAVIAALILLMKLVISLLPGWLGAEQSSSMMTWLNMMF